MAEQQQITAVILAGGRGSRLAPLTTVIPKPLVPVGDYPILEILIRQLVDAGITDIVISIGYLGHLIQAVVRDGAHLGAQIRYTSEDEPLGTAGALALVSDLSADGAVIVLNGDTLTDLNFRDLVTSHSESDAAATIVIVRREMKVDFGVIEVGVDHELVRYIEKPVYDYLVSIGVNVISNSALSNIEVGERVDMPDFMLRLRERGLAVRCAEHDCFWLDLGRIDDLRAASEIVAHDPKRFLPQ
jgi:NDP-sugar pyrophosphorylase family protein